MHRRSAPSWEHLVYSEDWRAWRDPDIPQWIDPVATLIGRHAAGALRDKTAIVADEDAVTYAQLEELVASVATGLAGLGLCPEQRILLFGTDSLDYMAAWLGAIRAGGVPAVVSDLYKAKELAYFLNDTAATALFIDSEQVPKLLEISDALPVSLRLVIVRGRIEPTVSSRLSGVRVVPFAEVRAAPPTGRAHLRHSNDVTYMFYSGGTTGTAKGITHLAHDFILVPERQGRFWEYSSSDVLFATSKKYFTHGLWPGALIPLYWGATVVLVREAAKAPIVLATLQKHRVTKLITVPTVLKNVVEHLRAGAHVPALPDLSLVISASEKIPPQLFDDFERYFGIEILDSIGSSEITYEWIANRPAESKRGSLGKPIFGYEVKLVDPDGNAIGQPHKPGEAWVRSRTACFFYWRKYDKSRETFIGDWTRTGDTLAVDEDGFFWFVGRDSDVFKVSGLWVSPIEIEAALMDHRAVQEAAVVSFEDSDGLIRPMAYVVVRPGVEPSPSLIDELRTTVRPLGGYKVPARIEFIPELPRTTLLKVDRKVLRQRNERVALRKEPL